MSKAKTKMICIRVSEDDYELLKNEHASRGVRSISELAREALRNVTATPPATQSALQAELQALDNRIKTLQTEVAHLLHKIKE